MNYKNKSWLEEKYIKEELNVRQIARICGVHKSSIQRSLKKFHIKTRNPWRREGTLHTLETKMEMSRTRSGSNNPMFGIISENHWNWKGGEKISNGYVYILMPEHPCSNVKGYVKRCRLVMEKCLGRYLECKEIPHHKNEIRDDDRIENLRLFSSQSKHTTFHNIMRQNVLFK